MRKRTGAAHHLIRLLRINSEPERHRHGLVELRRRKFLQRRDRLRQIVGLVAIHLLGGGAITFAAIILHVSSQFQRLFFLKIRLLITPLFWGRDVEAKGNSGIVKIETDLTELRFYLEVTQFAAPCSWTRN